jgi:hypothetical protein
MYLLQKRTKCISRPSVSNQNRQHSIQLIFALLVIYKRPFKKINPDRDSGQGVGNAKS